MNRKGLELLRQLEIGEKEEELLNDLLQNPLLPDLFKTFIKNYKIGKNWTTGELIIVDEQTNAKVWLTQITMYEPDDSSDYHACLDYIFDYEQLLNEVDKYYEKAENWNNLGFIQIGLMHWSDVLLIGVEGTNKDEIWRYGTGNLNQTFSKLTNNIFEFVGKLRESIDYENLRDYGIEPDQIYRNLNETFWKFKPSEK
ncbi:MAG: hypothetical protein KDC90_12830 [Ignavibacteriae bacterium]|nr:hypothetical protein [Ignavibacteriota bacterium]